MKPDEREAAQQQIRELELRLLRLQRRTTRLFILRLVSNILAFSAAFAGIRALARHEPFSIATMGIAAGCQVAFTALVWGGFSVWERWRP